MSHFSDMFKKPAKGFKAFTVLVNSCGNCVVFRLDEQGNPTDFSKGDAQEAIIAALRDACPNRPDFKIKQADRDNPRSYGFKCDTWDGVARAMNSKTEKGVRAQERYRVFWSHTGMPHFIEYNSRQKKYIPSLRGKEVDEDKQWNSVINSIKVNPWAAVHAGNPRGAICPKCGRQLRAIDADKRYVQCGDCGFTHGNPPPPSEPATGSQQTFPMCPSCTWRVTPGDLAAGNCRNCGALFSGPEAKGGTS